MKFYEDRYHTFFDHNIELDITDEFQVARHDFSLNKDFVVIPEYLVYYSHPDGDFNLAGQMDLLVKKGNDIYIFDYKTNAKGISTKAYVDRKKNKKQMMYHPINNMDDHTLNHYTLQLSIYAWMLQQINPELVIKQLTILHQDGDGIETVYPLEYRSEEVEKLIAYHAKQKKILRLRK